MILADGKPKKIGTGVSTWKGIFDQVATFPSRVNKVTFTTNVVTSEMQSVKLSGMLVWSIFRKDQGPFQAYKSFGEDLKKAVPNETNENLISQVSAIVRTVIASTSISEVLNTRNEIRDKIKNDM